MSVFLHLILDTSPSIHLTGKGRKQRSVPLWRSTVRVMRAWKRRSWTTASSAPLFRNRSGKAMSRSNVTQRLALAVEVAAQMNPQLNARSISPHTFRHTTAMHLLQSGVDMAMIDEVGKRLLTVTETVIQTVWPPPFTDRSADRHGGRSKDRCCHRTPDRPAAALSDRQGTIGGDRPGAAMLVNLVLAIGVTMRMSVSRPAPAVPPSPQ